MPPLFSLSRTTHAGTSDPFQAPAGSGALPAKQLKFKKGLLGRWRRTKEKEAAPISIERHSPGLAAARAAPQAKPVNYAVLKEMNRDRLTAAEAARHGDPKARVKADQLARALLPLAEGYLAWAQQQRGQDKVALRRRKVAGMVAQTMEAAAGGTRPSTAPAPPAGDNSPPRRSSVSSNGSSQRSNAASSSSSQRSSAASSVGDPEALSPAPAEPSGMSKQFSFRRTKEALASFRKTLTAPDPGTFKELEMAFKEAESAYPFDEGKALSVRKLAGQYLARHANASGQDEVRRAQLDLAQRYISRIDARILEDRWQRQRDIDTSCPQLRSPSLTERSRHRQRHAAHLVFRLAALHDAWDGTSERIVNQADGRPLYRFRPMPTRQVAAQTNIVPQYAVLASVLHRKLDELAGLNLRLPCATPAILDGVPGVLADERESSPPDDTQLSALPNAELQRAVLAQWVLGRPRATWANVNVEPQTGLLRPGRLPDTAHEPLHIARQALQGVSPMFSYPGSGEPIPGLHRPIDKALSDRLLSLDLGALAEAMDLPRDLIDVTNAANGTRAGLKARDLAVCASDAVSRLLEPLRALQSALRADPQLPLAMVLADAAEALSLSPHR